MKSLALESERGSRDPCLCFLPWLCWHLPTPVQQVETLVPPPCAARGRGAGRMMGLGFGAERRRARGSDRPPEQHRYKKIQTLSISFPIKYSSPRARAGEQKPRAVLTLCLGNNRVL